jgi:hypothetical protein
VRFHCAASFPVNRTQVIEVAKASSAAVIIQVTFIFGAQGPERFRA